MGTTNGACDTCLLEVVVRMYRGNTVGVVIPAYNEARFIGQVIDTVPAFVDQIYVVDDGSTDRTWAAIAKHATTTNQPISPTESITDGGQVRNDRVVPIRHRCNRGVGRAIKTGYRRAHAEGIDVTAVMAGDGQMEPNELTRLIDPVIEGAAAYAKGDRLGCRADRRTMSRWRQFGNDLLTHFTRLASGYPTVSDPQNGYTVISHRAIAELDIEECYDDYGFVNDLLVRLNAHGIVVCDVPMQAVYGEEQSTIRYSRFVPGLSRLLLKGFLWRLKTKYATGELHAVVSWCILGSGSGLVGALTAAHTAISGDDSESRVAHLCAAVLLTFLGLLGVGIAVGLDQREGTQLEAHRH